MRLRHGIFIGVLFGSAGAVFIAFGVGAGAETQPAAPSSQPIPTAFGPVSYFEDKCSNCHGPFGTAYGADFGKKLSESDLTKVCDDMASGPGRAPVDADQLKVLVEYHKAMIAKKPYVVVTSRRRDGTQLHLEGEVSPNAKVTVGKMPATVDEFRWSADVSAADAGAGVDITATVGDLTTTIHIVP